MLFMKKIYTFGSNEGTEYKRKNNNCNNNNDNNKILII